jgi:glycosyltransferase involved in cell wall biosynthesis
MSRVSIIIPCYRQAHFLGEAIRSAMGQSHADLEIVVVDDGSPDHTAAVVHGYPNVRYIQQANRGRGAARNRGLIESHGEYVVFLDADDRLLPHHVETNLHVLHGNSQIALSCGDYQWFGAESVWHKHNCQPDPDHYASLLAGTFRIAIHTAMFRRAVLEELKGFREDLLAVEDLHLFLQVAKHYPLVCHHTTTAEYRRHAGQTTRQNAFMLTWMMKVLADELPYVRKHPRYEKAFRAGIRQRSQAWGEPLLWETAAAFRSGRWKTGVQDLGCLVKYYPRGLLQFVLAKFGLAPHLPAR